MACFSYHSIGQYLGKTRGFAGGAHRVRRLLVGREQRARAAPVAGAERLRRALVAAHRRRTRQRRLSRTRSTAPLARGGSVKVSLAPQQDAGALVSGLAEHGIVSDHRSSVLRFSPGVITTRQDVETLDAALSGLRWCWSDRAKRRLSTETSRMAGSGTTRSISAAAMSGEGLAVSACASVARFSKCGIATTEASEVSLAMATELAVCGGMAYFSPVRMRGRRSSAPPYTRRRKRCKGDPTRRPSRARLRCPAERSARPGSSCSRRNRRPPCSVVVRSPWWRRRARPWPRPPARPAPRNPAWRQGRPWQRASYSSSCQSFLSLCSSFPVPAVFARVADR